MKPAFQRWAPVLTSKMAVVCVAAALLLRPGSGSAAEIGHYNGALFNIRDYFVPEPGLYAAVYNYFYTTDRLNNRKGNKVKSVTINLGETRSHGQRRCGRRHVRGGAATHVGIRLEAIRREIRRSHCTNLCQHQRA